MITLNIASTTLFKRKETAHKNRHELLFSDRYAFEFP